MIIKSFKLSKTKLLSCLFGICVIIALCAVMFTPPALATNAVTKDTKVKNSADIVRYLNQLSWEVESEPVLVKEVVIPKQFDDVYAKYNEIQKSQGFDLRKYAGKTVKSYSFKVINYLPDVKDEIRANILVYNNNVIAGDICSLAIDGFMKNLIKDQLPQINGE